MFNNVSRETLPKHNIEAGTMFHVKHIPASVFIILYINLKNHLHKTS